MVSDQLVPAAEDLAQIPTEQLISIVVQLRGILRAQEKTLTDIIDQRDAALALNELCHY